MISALAAGAALALAFAPFGYWPLAIVSPALLFFLWQDQTPRAAALIGFVFGVGTYGAGTYWLYISIHGFGQAPVWLALSLMAALVAIMACYSASLGYAAARWLPARGVWRWLVGLPAGWVLLEWVRGWFLSGFGWLSLGYSQTDTWLAAYAPIGGVPLVSWILLLGAGALVVLGRGSRREKRLALIVIVTPWLGGYGLKSFEWTQAEGDAVEIAIVQGAVSQDQKWLASNRDATLARYRDLTLQALGTPLIVWPEAAAPDLANNIVPYLQDLAAAAQGRDSALLMGLIRAEPGPGDEPLYYNSILAYDQDVHWYDKHHLVPFGEFFPVPKFVRRWLRLMNLPYSDFTSGAKGQSPLEIAGLRLSASICYEDAYPSTQLGSARESTALVNVTNDAWFGRSTARHQHLQISRMRAIESGRYVIRAANDGISALIGPRGEIIAQAPDFEPAVLRGSVTPRVGVPPYLRLGNVPWVCFAVLTWFAAVLIRRRERELPTTSSV
ncbi:MAG: apolipoprotein N-acyltransferase [Steroidobacteraceae bacterium]